MAIPHIVKCRACGKYFEAKSNKENIDWVMPSRNYYYHKPCYYNWKNLKKRPDNDWVDMIYDLLARDIKVSYNWFQIENQRKNFIEKHSFTNKGIYFTLYWYFYNKKQPWKQEYGIGIVPYIYEEATNYWITQERKTKGIVKQIEDLAFQRKKDQVALKPLKKRKKEIKAPE